METATYVVGALAAIATIVAGVFLSASHRDWGLWASGVAITFVIWAGVFWFQDRLWKKDAAPLAAPQPTPAEAAPADVPVHIETRDGSESRDPGWSVRSFIRIHHMAADRRKYILDLKGHGKDRVSIYISPNGIFTFSVVDSDGEPHVLQKGMGSGGIPLEEVFYLVCEASTGSRSITLRILVDGKVVESIEKQFRVDFGGLRLSDAAFGSSMDSSDDGAAFDSFAVGVFGASSTIEEIANDMANLTARQNAPFIQFNGHTSMRLQPQP